MYHPIHSCRNKKNKCAVQCQRIFSFLGKSIDNAAGSDYDNNINREKDMGTGNHM